MALRKITENDLAGKGVVGMADTPNLSARAMQEKVEEVVRSVVIPVINANVDETVSRQELAEVVFGTGGGDMYTAVYDADHDGVVDKALYAGNGVNTYIHSKNGTVHNLTGSGMYISFLAADDWNVGDRLKINGVEVQCFSQMNERIEHELLFKKQAWVFCMTDNDGTKCFFKTGGAGIPDGNTVTPANQIAVWQKCAGLQTVYTEIDKVLADKEAVTCLVNSTNAMAYFIRSTDIQAEALADEGFIERLDNSLPVISPSMQSVTAPYGKVSHKGYPYNTYEAFRYPAVLTETMPSAYLGNTDGAYVQYEFRANTACPWVYKVTIAAYGTRQYRLAAILEDGSEVYLTDWVNNKSGVLPSVNQDIVTAPHSCRCRAVRIYTIGDVVNNYNYLRGGKIWGK